MMDKEFAADAKRNADTCAQSSCKRKRRVSAPSHDQSSACRCCFPSVKLRLELDSVGNSYLV